METEATIEARSARAPIDASIIEGWFLQGHIHATQRAVALEVLHGPKQWQLWIGRLLLSLGVACLLSGIVFFFAFNWQDLPKFAKLGAVEVGMVLSLLGALMLRANPVGQGMLTLCAAVLVGVFLAVFGQIYQTGADAYQLFVGWALLITPWVLLARLLPLWALWCVIVNVALVLYMEQSYLGRLASVPMYGVAMLLNGGLLALREWLVKQGCAWVAPVWSKYSLVMMALVPAFVILTRLIVHFSAFTTLLPWAVLSVAVHAGIWWFYRLQSPDIRVVSTLVFSMSTLVLILMIRLLNDISDFGMHTLLLCGLMTYGVYAFAVSRMRVIANSMEVTHA